MNPVTLSQGPQLAPGAERRRSQRVFLRVAVTLHLAAPGQQATIRAHTMEVNDHGAMLISPQGFPAGTTLELENDRTRQRQRCRVVRAPREDKEGFQVPVEFEKPALGFWQISFPPTN